MKKTKSTPLLFCFLICMILSACGQAKSVGIIGGADGPTAILVSEEINNDGEYKQISQDEAKLIMDSDDAFTILDVRTQEEFDEGHIGEAILLPYDSIDEKSASELLPDKNKMILVYCRSGRRSKIAAESLAKLGYTNVLEFGGINEWKYEIVK